MLILSRKVGEAILIGDEVVVKVVGLGRGRVRLGIEAPGDVGVWRLELRSPATTEAVGRPARGLAASVLNE